MKDTPSNAEINDRIASYRFNEDYWRGFEAAMAWTLSKARKNKRHIYVDFYPIQDRIAQLIIDSLETREIAGLLGITIIGKSDRNSRVIAQAMRALGYTHKQKSIKGRPLWVWIKPE